MRLDPSAMPVAADTDTRASTRRAVNDSPPSGVSSSPSRSPPAGSTGPPSLVEPSSGRSTTSDSDRTVTPDSTERPCSQVVLAYESDFGPAEWVDEKLTSDGHVTLSRVFTVQARDLLDNADDDDDGLMGEVRRFVIGKSSTCILASGRPEAWRRGMHY